MRCLTVASSEKGEWLIEKCKKYFDIFDADLAEILASQSHNKDHLFDEKRWNKNFEILSKSGLKQSLNNINKEKPALVRLKRFAYIHLSNIKSKFIQKN